MKFDPPFPGFREKINKSFAAQSIMKTIGAVLSHIEPGEADVEVPFRNDLTQQNGFIHAGITTAIVDSACGFAALSLMDEDSEVLSVEFKINLLSPAIGKTFRAEGRVVRPGKTIFVVRGEVFAVSEAGEKIVAAMQGTMMQMYKR